MSKQASSFFDLIRKPPEPRWKRRLRRVWRFFVKGEYTYHHHWTWHWYGLRQGLSNFWRFRKSVYHFNASDYSYLLWLMADATQEMSRHHREDGVAADRDKMARQLLVVTELCKRLREGNYFMMAGYRRGLTSAQASRVFAHSDYMAKQDVEYLGKMLRHMRSWWD